LSLNSANGGFLVDWEASQDVVNICRRLIDSINSPASKEPIQPEVADAFLARDAQLLLHFQHYFRFTRDAFHENKDMDDVHIADLVRMCVDQSSHQPMMNTVIIGKDITKSALNDVPPFFTEEQAYHGPTFFR
jgi:hypothetical protein